MGQKVATKENRRQARGLIEALESRAHAGPPILEGELSSAREFLRQNDFSEASDYFNRLTNLQNLVATRRFPPLSRPEKRNYGGEAAGSQMQVQSIYDHVILSTCYDGEFNTQSGRIKLSHRFNQAGRIDFVELKFLRALLPCLNGEYRKLLTVQGYQTLRKDWHTAEAFVLPVLPRELLFLYEAIFRCPKTELFAWLINIGHRLAAELIHELRAGRVNGCHSPSVVSGQQLCLKDVISDRVALPIIEKAAVLESVVEVKRPELVVVRYLTRQNN